MNIQKQEILRWLIGCGLVILISLLIYGIYIGCYEYTYYRDYKSVRNLKICQIDHEMETIRFEIDLPVKFVSTIHDSEISQRIYVRTDNRKIFMLLRFRDKQIQLMKVPIARYFYSNKYYSAYYEITDPSKLKEIHNLLDHYSSQ